MSGLVPPPSIKLSLALATSGVSAPGRVSVHPGAPGSPWLLRRPGAGSEGGDACGPSPLASPGTVDTTALTARAARIAAAHSAGVESLAAAVQGLQGTLEAIAGEGAARKRGPRRSSVDSVGATARSSPVDSGSEQPEQRAPSAPDLLREPFLGIKGGRRASAASTASSATIASVAGEVEPAGRQGA